MSLTSQLINLTDTQIHELHNRLLEACTAMELGGDWREVFRRARHRRTGRMRRLYDLLYNADRSDIDRAAKHLVDPLNDGQYP